MKIGYARVSTQEQNLDLQVEALNEFGCDQVRSEKVSGTKKNRPVLSEILEHIREGDTLVVWRLDRLSRKLTHILEIMEDLEKRNVNFVSLHDSIDTNTAVGKMYFHMCAVFAEFERNVISERTRAGLERAKEKGIFGGPKFKLTPTEANKLYKEYQARTMPRHKLAEKYGIAVTTLYRYIGLLETKEGKAYIKQRQNINE